MLLLNFIRLLPAWLILASCAGFSLASVDNASQPAAKPPSQLAVDQPDDDEKDQLRAEIAKLNEDIAALQQNYDRRLTELNQEKLDLVAANQALEQLINSLKRQVNQAQATAGLNQSYRPTVAEPEKSGSLHAANSHKNLTSKEQANSLDDNTSQVTSELYVDFKDPDLIAPTGVPSLFKMEGAQIDYTKAYGVYLNGEYVKSIILFSEFLDKFYSDPYSHNAEYWLGMSYFMNKNYDFAEKHFRRVLTNFAHKGRDAGFKTADAIYMLGRIYEKRSLLDRSNYYFWQVVELFPSSNSASNARKKLRNNVQSIASE